MAAALGVGVATVHGWAKNGWVTSSRNPIGRPAEKKEPRRATAEAANKTERRATAAAFIVKHPTATPSEVAEATGCTASAIRHWAREGHIPSMPNGMRVKRNKGLTREDVVYCRSLEDKVVLTAALRDIPFVLVAEALGCTPQAVGQRLKRIAERRDHGRSS